MLYLVFPLVFFFNVLPVSPSFSDWLMSVTTLLFGSDGSPVLKITFFTISLICDCWWKAKLWMNVWLSNFMAMAVFYSVPGYILCKSHERFSGLVSNGKIFILVTKISVVRSAFLIIWTHQFFLWREEWRGEILETEPAWLTGLIYMKRPLVEVWSTEDQTDGVWSRKCTHSDCQIVRVKKSHSLISGLVIGWYFASASNYDNRVFIAS